MALSNSSMNFPREQSVNLIATDAFRNSKILKIDCSYSLFSFDEPSGDLGQTWFFLRHGPGVHHFPVHEYRRGQSRAAAVQDGVLARGLHREAHVLVGALGAGDAHVRARRKIVTHPSRVVGRDHEQGGEPAALQPSPKVIHRR